MNVELSAGRGRGGATGVFSPLVESWSKFRGPGDVTFSQVRPTLDRNNAGKGTTTATFSAPGDYILRVQANDSSREGDFWREPATAEIIARRVTGKPRAGSAGL